MHEEDMASVKRIPKELPPMKPRGSGPSDRKEEETEFVQAVKAVGAR